MRKLNSIEETNKFIKENKFAIIYFSSHNCSVCVDLLPKVKDLLKNYPKINFGEVEVDNSPEIAGNFNIFTLPGILIYINRKETIREARFISIHQLEGKISRYYDMLF